MLLAALYLHWLMKKYVTSLRRCGSPWGQSRHPSPPVSSNLQISRTRWEMESIFNEHLAAHTAVEIMKLSLYKAGFLKQRIQDYFWVIKIWKLCGKWPFLSYPRLYLWDFIHLQKFWYLHFIFSKLDYGIPVVIECLDTLLHGGHCGPYT